MALNLEWEYLCGKYPKSQPYESYKLLWMLEHGHSIPRLIRELQRVQDEKKAEGENLNVMELFEAWEGGYGFGGEVWNSFDEWVMKMKQYKCLRTR